MRGVGVTVVRCASFAVASVLLCLRFASNGCLAPSWPAAADLAPPGGCSRTQLRAGLRFWPRRLTGSLAWLPRCGRSPAPLGSLASAAAKPGGALLGGAPPPSPALLCYVTLTREQRCIGRAHRPPWPPTVHPGPPPSLQGDPSVGSRRWRVVAAAQTPRLPLPGVDATLRVKSLPPALGVRRALFAGPTREGRYSVCCELRTRHSHRLRWTFAGSCLVVPSGLRASAALAFRVAAAADDTMSRSRQVGDGGRHGPRSCRPGRGGGCRATRCDTAKRALLLAVCGVDRPRRPLLE